MKRKKLYLLLSLLTVLVILMISVYKHMYKEHRNIAAEDVAFNISASKLKGELSIPTMAHEYIDQVVQTYGSVTNIEQNAVVIDDQVQVSFIEPVTIDLTLQSQITIKGRCVGYDDLLELVKIDQATLIKN